jgi:protein-disulfide isomerase
MVEAQQHGITGTPAIFINGRKLKQRTLSGFQKLIDEELKKLNK